MTEPSPEPSPEQGPGYDWLRELKRSRGRHLRQQYGAHSLGIGWKRVGGRKTDDLALIFYVENKGAGAEPIPAAIAFTPPGSHDHVLLQTDVVESPPAVFE